MVKFYIMMIKDEKTDFILDDVPARWRGDVEWEMEHGEKENFS